MSIDAFDKDALLEELEDDWEFLEESVDMLKEDGAGLIDSIRNGAHARDAEAVWRGAHTVKSMVGNFAAGPAQELAYSLEQRGRANDLDGIVDDIDTLGSELERLVQALESLLSEPRT